MATSKQLLARIIGVYSQANLTLLERIARKESRGNLAAYERARMTQHRASFLPKRLEATEDFKC